MTSPAEDTKTLRERTLRMLKECRDYEGDSFGKTLGEADALVELAILADSECSPEEER